MAGTRATGFLIDVLMCIGVGPLEGLCAATAAPALGARPAAHIRVVTVTLGQRSRRIGMG